jgi:hypothetical protein
MLDHRLESLEGRSLLSTTLLPDGMPGADAAGQGATIAHEVPGAADDSDMYSFHRGVDDAVYEEADPTEDGGDRYQWDGGAFDDTVQFDLSSDGTMDDESHPWIGLGAETDSADQVDPIDDNLASDPGEGDMADAVAVAHEPTAVAPWLNDGDTSADDGVDATDVTDTTGVSVQFSFDGGSAMPSYRDLAL